MDLELRTNEQLLRDLICQIEDDVTNALTDLSRRSVALRDEILNRMSFRDLNVPDDEPQDQESDGQPA
jgi:hypothetical protein